jgi:hypothetical protein
VTTTPPKPRPTMAALIWIDRHAGNAEAAVADFEAFEKFEALGNRIGRTVLMTESIAGSLARGTIGRRQAVEMLRELHQALAELGRDLEPSFPPQSRERWRWNLASNGLAPWQPAAIHCENATRYGKPKNGEGV